MPERGERERFKRLLVVEDDPSHLRTLTAIMRKEGFEVVGCSRASEALERVEREEFGIALLDLRLPDLSGTELLEKMRLLDREILVIFNTAYGSFDSAKAAVNLHAFAYVEKAGDPGDLVRQVHAASRAHLDRYAQKLEEAVAARTRELIEANSSLRAELTERARAEEEKEALEFQLRQAQKMEAIGQLAGGVAHDFNNILTVILGNLECSIEGMRSDLRADDPLLQWLEEAQRSALSAATLTRRLLAFSSRQVSRPGVLDINRTLSGMEEMLRRIITEHIVMRVALDSDLRRVCADVGEIEQIVMNLVVNACAAMPKGGELTLATANVMLGEADCSMRADLRPGPHVMLRVSDTGSGMNLETLERIFEPFFTTKPIGQGTGLGLAIVYGIVRRAGGDIEVKSKPGEGTTFRILLPAVEADTTESPARQDGAPLCTGSETILVCEDDEAVRNLAVRILESAGYSVISAGNGEHALALLTEFGHPIHLLLTDVVMPKMNGKQLADAMTAARPDLKTLFVSGYSSDVIAPQGLLDEGVELLEKPFSRCSLLQRVRGVLDWAGRPNP